MEKRRATLPLAIRPVRSLTVLQIANLVNKNYKLDGNSPKFRD